MKKNKYHVVWNEHNEKIKMKLIPSDILKSISVYGTLETETGICEYQGVFTETGEVLFHEGPFQDGSIKIVEFLAIVQALKYCKEKNLSISICSDNKYAIRCVDSRSIDMELTENDKLIDLILQALRWLDENDYSNKLLKWESIIWGENPAAFGKKIK